jgi:GT2 family glycosyltransferase/lipopolysaccharide/colanic/teichoic acid biosynthesis glycosyltransferase
VDVSVIIVTYNSKPVLGACLESLKRQSSFDRTEVIVVDNASSDGTSEMVRERYPWVDLCSEKVNAGLSAAVNTGIHRASGRYFLILNPDTVLRERAIEILCQFMDRARDAGIVGPKLVFHDGNVQYSCRRFYTWKVLILRRTFLGKIFKDSRAIADHLMLDFNHEVTRKVDWVIGACMFVRREAVRSVGLMDERFFLYFEDVDWCYRMKQRGWSVYYHPDAVVVHDYARESAQSVFNRPFMAHLASLIRYYEKWSVVLYVIKKYREPIKVALFLLIDLVAFNLAFLAAYYTRLATGGFFARTLLPIGAYEQFVVFENILFVFGYMVLGLYKIRRETSTADELFAIAKAVAAAAILLMASTYLSQIHSYSRVVVALLVPYAIAFDALLRTLVRRFHRSLLAQKIDLKRVCVVGRFEEAHRWERALTADPSRGIDVVGIIATGGTDAGSGARSLGKLADIDDIVDKFRVQELVFLPGAVPDDRLAEFVGLRRRRVLDVTVLADYSGLVVHHATVTSLAGHPVIAYRRDTKYGVDRIGKRVLDIALGLVFLIVSLPCCMVYFIYTSVRGGTAYTHESRLGLRGRPVALPVAGAKDSNGPSDIVNLPLFWLVVTGRLSMVGPYPLPSVLADRLEGVAAFRFDFRPGVTGQWRVGRGEGSSLSGLLAQDAGYASNWSLAEDVKIFVTTLPNILRGRKRSLKLTASS